MSSAAPSLATGLSAAIGPLRGAVDSSSGHGSTPTRETASSQRVQNHRIVRDRDDRGAVVAQARDDARRARPRWRHPARRSARRAPCTCGRVASIAATVSRRFSPPESVYGFAPASAPSRRRSSSSSTRVAISAAGRPSARGPTSSSARTVVVSSWCSGSWKTVPMRVSSARDGQRSDRRPTPGGQSVQRPTTRPDSGGIRPASVRPSVDLPAPLGPVMRAPRRRSPRRRSRTGDRAAANPRDDERVGRQQRAAGWARRRRRERRGDAGDPHARARRARAPSRRGARHPVGRRR